VVLRTLTLKKEIMKRIIFSTFAAAFAVLFFLTSCDKNNLNDNIYYKKSPEKALVRFVNSYTALTPTLASPANGPIVDFYINNVKMTAKPLAYTGFYPNTSGGGAFAEAPSGEVEIKAVLNRPLGGGLPGDTIAKGKFMLGPNVSHSIILVDTLPNPTPFNPILMVVQESVSLATYGKFKVRFMNMIATNELYEVYNSTTATVVTTGPIAFKNFSDWIELPISASGNTFQLRVVGTTTAVLSQAFTFTNLRSYTIWARGTNPAIPVGANVLSRARSWVNMTTQ
jgi:hypothetical protein